MLRPVIRLDPALCGSITLAAKVPPGANNRDRWERLILRWHRRAVSPGGLLTSAVATNGVAPITSRP